MYVCIYIYTLLTMIEINYQRILVKLIQGTLQKKWKHTLYEMTTSH